MTFLEIAKSRYSCRNYKPDAIKEEELFKVLEAFHVAPSAVNFQPWRVIVVKLPDNLAKVHEAYNREWFKTAPTILIVCSDHSVSWKRAVDNKDYADVDIAIAIDHLVLQATELGLATCWVCNFKPDIIRHNFKLPAPIEPMVLIPIGYPEDTADPNRHDSKRKGLIDFVSWENL